MSTDKSGRKKLAKVFITITILIIASVLGINVTDIIPNEGSNTDIAATIPAQNSSQITNPKGELILTMIDQTCPIMIQRLNNIFQRNPLISMGI